MVMRIKELRKQVGYTQAQLSIEVGVTQSIISDWENEVYLPRTRDLPALARLFHCSISDLFVTEAEAS